MKHKLTFPFQVKDADDTGTFSGLASVYGNVDLGGDVVERGAFSKTLSENPTVPVLWQHDSREVIGSGVLRNTREGLAIDATLDMEDPVAQKAYRKLKKGYMKGLSIGFDTMEDEVKNNIRHLKEIKLWEVSVVTFPMQLGAMVNSVKRMVQSHKDDFRTELDAAQTWANQYMMLSALSDSLSDAVYGEGSDEEIQSAVEESINQFSVAFLDYLPKLLALLDTPEYGQRMAYWHRTDGREFAAARVKQIEEVQKSLQARIAKAAEPGTLKSEPAAVPGAEPGYPSAIATLIDSTREFLQQRTT